MFHSPEAAAEAHREKRRRVVAATRHNQRLAPRATLLRQDEGVDPVAPRVRGQLLERRPRLLELCTKGEARVRVAGGRVHGGGDGAVDGSAGRLRHARRPWRTGSYIAGMNCCMRDTAHAVGGVTPLSTCASMKRSALRTS